MLLPNPFDVLLAVKVGEQFIQPAVRPQGLVGCVAENPTRLAAVDPRFKHAVNQSQIELAIHKNARAFTIRHLIPLDTLSAVVGAVPECVNPSLVNTNDNFFFGLAGTKS